MKKHTFYSLIHIFFFFSTLSICQTTFFKTFGNPAEGRTDQGLALIQTEVGEYIVAGEYNRYSEGPPNHYYGDVYLIRTSEFGDTIWTQTYGDSSTWESAYAIEKNGTGGYIISAYNFSQTKLWLLNLDEQGLLLWAKTYPLGIGNCIKRTSDGGYIITGTGGNDGSDLFLLKIDSQGETLWLKSYGNPNQDEGRYVQQTTDGGYIITGFTEFPAPRGSDIWLLKTDYKGDTLWTKTYGGKYFDGAFSVSETKNGGYFITGQYTVDGELGLEIHIWLLKTDSNGDTIWTKKINNGSWGDYAYSCKPTSDSGFIIVGETTYDNFDSDIYLLKLDRDYNVEWSNTIGRDLVENGDEKRFRGNDVTETVDGGYLITGFKRVEIEWDKYQDLCIVKTNNKGQLTDVIETKTKIPLTFELSQNYPNPFNPSTEIEFQLLKQDMVSLKIFDLLGNEIETLLNEEKEKGCYKVKWDGKDKNGVSVGTGVYLYQLRTGVFEQSRKMILLK